MYLDMFSHDIFFISDFDNSGKESAATIIRDDNGESELHFSGLFLRFKLDVYIHLCINF